MKNAVFFDVDDTLYNQLTPFQAAFENQFNFDDIAIADLYKLSRKLSDSVFSLSESGAMSLQEMHVFRIKEALKRFGYAITDQEALAFQEDYVNLQQTIHLSPTLSTLFDWLAQQDIDLGLITNGPSSHQRRKIDQLGLRKWIANNHIFISSELNAAKPNKTIFNQAKKAVSADIPVNQLYYVGDSFANDIIGAKQAGWRAIWFNRRSHFLGPQTVSPDWIVSSDDALYCLLTHLFADRKH